MTTMRLWITNRSYHQSLRSILITTSTRLTNRFALIHHYTQVIISIRECKCLIIITPSQITLSGEHTKLFCTKLLSKDTLEDIMLIVTIYIIKPLSNRRKIGLCNRQGDKECPILFRIWPLFSKALA